MKMDFIESLVNFLLVLIGFTFMLLYPVYESKRLMEGLSSSRDQQKWLTYWILFSFLNLFELYCSTIISWIPLWSYVKLIFCMWLTLPRFNGAAYIYENFAMKIESKERSKHHSEQEREEREKDNDYFKEEGERERFRDHFKEEEEDEEMKIFKAWKLVEDYIDRNGSDSLERIINAALEAEEAETNKLRET